MYTDDGKEQDVVDREGGVHGRKFDSKRTRMMTCLKPAVVKKGPKSKTPEGLMIGDDSVSSQWTIFKLGSGQAIEEKKTTNYLKNSHVSLGVRGKGI